MPETISSQNCPDCGAPLPGDSPQALCPACLLRQALTSRTIVAEGGKAPTAPPPSPKEIAVKFPQFEILECLGRGGMGVVYKARQKSLNRLVAIKILAPEREHDAWFAERFAREAELLAKLSHPHIVTIHDFGETGGLYYLVMEFVDGVNLRDLLRDGKMEPRQALAIVPEICDALQFAHDHGIVHRDIKPGNILLDRLGRVKVADFGLAKLISSAADADPGQSTSPMPATGDLTEAGKVMGTPSYMAPEQTDRPGEVDSRADIFALGVVFYQMLTGELPGKPIEPPSRKVQIDVRLDEVVLRALEKSPELRWQTATDLGTRVETIAASERSGAGNPGSETMLSALIKSERGRLGLQESPGGAASYPSVGELALHTDRMVISSGYQQRTIPLADIRGLGEAMMPWWFSPAGHRYAGVDFDEGGQRRKLAFLPGTPYFRTVRDSQMQSAEWLGAIQRAVKSATGAEFGINRTPVAMPVKSLWSAAWLLVPVIFGALLAAKSVIVGGKGNSSALWMFIPLWPLLILFPILAWRYWSGRRGGDGNPCDPTRPPADPTVQSECDAETLPRFSRTAIAGACLGILSVVLFAFAVIINQVAARPWLPTGEVLPNKPAEFVSSVLMVGALVCAFGPALFGWVAVSQIRRSAGKIYGMWLALIDGIGGIIIASGISVTLVAGFFYGHATPEVHNSVKQVSAVTARKGDIRVNLTAMGTVSSSNSVIFAIPEDYCQEVIRKFDAHQELAVEADNRQGDKFGYGSLVGVDNQIDPTTGTLKCRASLIPEGENLMVPGQFLNIRILLELKHGVTLVPIVAIQHDSGSAYVWVIQSDHTLTHRPVRVGAIDGGWIEIQNGLSPGEIVVSGGPNDLREEQKVVTDSGNG